MKITKTRSLYIPKNAELIAKDERFGFEVYRYELNGSVCALAFAGKRQKPDWNFRFRDEARMHEKISSTLAALMAAADYKAERRAKQNSAHSLKVGDVLKSSWGYDQTNIDFYEVVDVPGPRTVVIREIAQERQETGFMSGRCVPQPGRYIGKPMTKRANSSNHVRINSCASAWKIEALTVAGCKVFNASHWTAYA